MTPTALFTTVFVVLPAVGLVIWAWTSMAQLEAALRSRIAFDRTHFEIGRHATEVAVT